MLVPPKWTWSLRNLPDHELLARLRDLPTIDDAARAFWDVGDRYYRSLDLPDNLARELINTNIAIEKRKAAGEISPDSYPNINNFFRLTPHPHFGAYIAKNDNWLHLAEQWYLPFAYIYATRIDFTITGPSPSMESEDQEYLSRKVLYELARGSLSLEGDLLPKALAGATATASLSREARTHLAIIAMQPWSPPIQSTTLSVATLLPQEPIIGKAIRKLLDRHNVHYFISPAPEKWLTLAKLGETDPFLEKWIASWSTQVKDHHELWIKVMSGDAGALRALLASQSRRKMMQAILVALLTRCKEGQRFSTSFLDVMYDIIWNLFKHQEFEREDGAANILEYKILEQEVDNQNFGLATQILAIHGDPRVTTMINASLAQMRENDQVHSAKYQPILPVVMGPPVDWAFLNLAMRDALLRATYAAYEYPCILASLAVAGVDILALADGLGLPDELGDTYNDARWRLLWPLRRALWAGHLFALGGPGGWVGTAALGGDYASVLKDAPKIISQLDALKAAADALEGVKHLLGDRGKPIATSHEVIKDPVSFGAWYLEAIPDVFGGGAAIHVIDPGRPAWVEALRAKYCGRVARRRGWAFLSIDPRGDWRAPLEQFLASTPLKDIPREVLLAGGGWSDCARPARGVSP